MTTPYRNMKDRMKDIRHIPIVALRQAAVVTVLVFPTLLNVCHGSPSSAAGTLSRFTALARTVSTVSSSQLDSLVVLNTTAITMTAPPNVVRIEEDWELNVTQPDVDLAAPQVGTVMSPCADLSSLYVAFLVNHRIDPSYDPGGMELQVYQQDTLLDWVDRKHDPLNTASEQVTWTQCLELQGDQFTIEISNGNSASWGAFGKGGFKLTLTTNLTDLSGYHSGVSVENSGVTYASHRVSSLVLKSVRGYASDGSLVFEEPDPVIVFESSEVDDN